MGPALPGAGRMLVSVPGWCWEICWTLDVLRAMKVWSSLLPVFPAPVRDGRSAGGAERGRWVDRSQGEGDNAAAAAQPAKCPARGFHPLYVRVIHRRPSMSSRAASRWPAWQAVSVMTCSRTSRRLCRCGSPKRCCGHQDVVDGVEDHRDDVVTGEGLQQFGGEAVTGRPFVSALVEEVRAPVALAPEGVESGAFHALPTLGRPAAQQ